MTVRPMFIVQAVFSVSKVMFTEAQMLYLVLSCCKWRDGRDSVAATLWATALCCRTGGRALMTVRPMFPVWAVFSVSKVMFK